MTPRVVVVGDVAVDVLVAPRSPMVPGADVPASIRSSAGGAGANTAAWLAHLGAQVTLVARVGDDAAGRAAAAELSAAGVRPALALDRERPTCCVVALLGDPAWSAGGTRIDMDRTLLSDRGAAAHLSPADLPALDGADHLHLSGYVLLDPSSRPAGIDALASARAAGLTTSVDPQVAPALTSEFRSWIRGVDLLLPNADELRALGGADTLLAEVGAVASTAGVHGAIWEERRRAACGPEHQQSGRWSVPAPLVEVVDATGAGDAFNAGLLVAWLGGAGPVEALRAGCAAGAEAVGVLGGRPSLR